MWTRSCTVTTKEVTREQLWQLFSDVNNWHTWDDSIEFARLQGEFAVGNTFQLRPKGGPTVTIRLQEIIENSKFVDCTSFPLAKMYGSHTFEDTPEGVRITVTMSVQGLLSFLWVRLVAQGIVNSLEEDINRQIQAAKHYEIKQ
ncbi:MAG: SRPBCC family protein [Ignavibacteria bacterium]|nr:SRPBCC family protein [Ignavibacteria bacterium]